MMKPWLSIVFPAYNEEDRIGDAIRRCARYFGPGGYWGRVDLVVVANGCTDRTAAVATEAAMLALRGHNNLRFSLLRSRKGKGAAVRKGVLNTSGSLVYIADVDLSTPLTELPNLIVEINRTDADLVIGSRRVEGADVEGVTGLRGLASWGFSAAAGLLVPDVQDTQCGFKLIRRSAANQIFSRLRLDGFAYDVEMLHVADRLGYTIRERPVKWVHDDRSSVRLVRDSASMFLGLIKIAGLSLGGVYTQRRPNPIG
jgi:dolichyl-phosphate beta-glucosyltransferase